VDIVALESRHDIGRSHAAVEVTVFGGVRLDGDALLGQLSGLFAELGLPGQLDCCSLALCLSTIRL
jgi:hypothetical protein